MGAGRPGRARLGRPAPSAMPALATAVLVLVLLDPDLAAAPGFALSVLATAGLLLLAPAGGGAGPAAARLAGRRRSPSRLRRRWPAGRSSSRCSAQLGLLSVPANLLAVPAVAPGDGDRRRGGAARPGLAAARRRPSPGSAGCRRRGWCASPTPARRCPGRRCRGPRAHAARCCWRSLTLVARRSSVRRRRWRRALAAGTAGAVAAAAGLTRAAARPGRRRAGSPSSATSGRATPSSCAPGPGTAVVVDAGPDPAAVDRCLRRLRRRPGPAGAAHPPARRPRRRAARRARRTAGRRGAGRPARTTRPSRRAEVAAAGPTRPASRCGAPALGERRGSAARQLDGARRRRAPTAAPARTRTTARWCCGSRWRASGCC